MNFKRSKKLKKKLDGSWSMVMSFDHHFLPCCFPSRLVRELKLARPFALPWFCPFAKSQTQCICSFVPKIIVGGGSPFGRCLLVLLQYLALVEPIGFGWFLASMISICFGLFCGSIGILSSFLFTNTIYGAVNKVD
jgi:hypothetical protein